MNTVCLRCWARISPLQFGRQEPRIQSLFKNSKSYSAASQEFKVPVNEDKQKGDERFTKDDDIHDTELNYKPHLRSLSGILQDTYFPSVSPPIVHLNRTFLQTASPFVIPLLQALSSHDDKKWWFIYSQLYHADLLPRLTAGEFSLVLRSLHPSRMRDLFGTVRGLRAESQNQYKRDQFIKRCELVKRDMQRAGHALSIIEWNHLLDCARGLGDSNLTKKWWKELIRSNVDPDVVSYNTYIASTIGTAQTLLLEEPILTEEWVQKGIEKELEDPRRRAPDSYNRYRNKRPIPNAGARATTIVQEMINRFIPPNTMTYELLLLARARSTDLAGMNAIVEKIWNLPSQESHRLNNRVPEVSLPIGSPLYPTSNTLMVIAAAYGYNAQLSSAVSYIDKLSSRYKLKIPMAAWLTLLHYSILTSTTLQSRWGYTPPSAAGRLFRIMQADPYNVRPGVPAYWAMIRHEFKRGLPTNVENLLLDLVRHYGSGGSELGKLDASQQTALSNEILQGVKGWILAVAEFYRKAGGFNKRGRGGNERALIVCKRWKTRLDYLEENGRLPDDENADMATDEDQDAKGNQTPNLENEGVESASRPPSSLGTVGDMSSLLNIEVSEDEEEQLHGAVEPNARNEKARSKEENDHNTESDYQDYSRREWLDPNHASLGGELNAETGESEISDNPYWIYLRNKLRSEEALWKYRQTTAKLRRLKGIENQMWDAERIAKRKFRAMDMIDQEWETHKTQLSQETINTMQRED